MFFDPVPTNDAHNNEQLGVSVSESLFSSMKRLDAYSFIIYCIFGFEGSSDLEPVSSVKTISVAFLWKAVSDELGNMWIYGPCRLILGRSKSLSVHYSFRSEATDQYTSA